MSARFVATVGNGRLLAKIGADGSLLSLCAPHLDSELLQRPVHAAIERPCDPRVDMFVADRPLEEGARSAALAADVERVSDECALHWAGGERARAIVVLRDGEHAACVKAGDRGAV